MASLPTEGGSKGGSWSAEVRPSRVTFGAGALAGLGEVAKELGAHRVLIITDPGVRSAGHVDRALEGFRAAALPAFVFDGVEENPSERHVAAGVEAARRHGVDFLVGLGGGSSMDCAKGVNFVFTNGGRMEDYWGLNKARQPMLTSVGVPCTAGTGSEAQSYALICRESDHRKMACGDEKARFHSVILDPELARTAPPDVVSVAGFDALSHAVESYVTRVRNPFSRLFAAEAWRRLEPHYEAVLAPGAGLEAWGEMLLGAHFAGAAIESSMLGAAHACANPLTANYGVTHGIAVALMLPHVIRWNGEEPAVAALYTELAGGEADSSSDRLARRIEELCQAAALPACLREVGVEAAALETLAGQAAEQWTAGFNPRAASVEAMRGLYEAAF